MKAAVLIVEEFEQIEALTPVDLLRRAGIEVDLVSVFNEKYIKSSHNVTIEVDKFFNDIDFENYDMIILPGGPGTKNYEKSEKLLEKIKEYSKNNNKYIGAICAAPGILAKIGLLEGKKAVSFPAVEQELEKNGAVLTKDRVIADKNIITSRGAGTAVDFSLKLIEILKGREKSDETAKEIIYE